MDMDARARNIVIGTALLAVVAAGAGIFYFLGARGEGSAGQPLPASQSAIPRLMNPLATPAPAASAQAMVAPGGQGVKGVPTMEDAAGKLAKRLGQKGGSAEDWALLARSYVELKQYPEATRAFAQAIEKAPGDEKLKLEAANARQAAAGAAAAR